MAIVPNPKPKDSTERLHPSECRKTLLSRIV
jgi:hypothetical protein